MPTNKSRSNENKALRHLRAQLRKAKARNDWQEVEKLQGMIRKIEERRETS